MDTELVDTKKRGDEFNLYANSLTRLNWVAGDVSTTLSLNDVGVVELLEEDKRPTFIIDLQPPEGVQEYAISIVFCNRSLRTDADLRNVLIVDSTEALSYRFSAEDQISKRSANLESGLLRRRAVVPQPMIALSPIHSVRCSGRLVHYDIGGESSVGLEYQVRFQRIYQKLALLCVPWVVAMRN